MYGSNGFNEELCIKYLKENYKHEGVIREILNNTKYVTTNEMLLQTQILVKFIA